MKYTNQRVEILEFLKDNLSHPTVEQVYDGVRKKLSRISRATVYQNLKILADKGMIQEVNIKGVARFEPNTEPHHHIICKKCSTITDFVSDKLTKHLMNLARKFKDVDIESTDTHFYGLCKKCNT